MIYVRRSVWNGQELEPKTENAVREIDIDPVLVALLRKHIGSSRRTRLFEARNGAPLSAGNIRNRIFHPLLAKLGIPKAGLHAFRHSRVTLLRKNGTPADLQRQWIGHSSLKTTDRYSHTDQELEYRRKAASRVGLDLIVGPNEHAAALAAVAVNVIGEVPGHGEGNVGREGGQRRRRHENRERPGSTMASLDPPRAEATARHVNIGYQSLTRRGPKEGRRIRKSRAFRANRTRRSVVSARFAKLLIFKVLARPAGLEPATSWFVG